MVTPACTVPWLHRFGLLSRAIADPRPVAPGQQVLHPPCPAGNLGQGEGGPPRQPHPGQGRGGLLDETHLPRARQRPARPWSVLRKQDRHLGRRLANRQTADTLECIFDVPNAPSSVRGRWVLACADGGTQGGRDYRTGARTSPTGVRTRPSGGATAGRGLPGRRPDRATDGASRGRPGRRPRAAAASRRRGRRTGAGRRRGVPVAAHPPGRRRS